jgi:outer membrane protein
MRNTLFAALITSGLLSLDAHAIDLLQVYKEALANDPVYASARASLAAGAEKTPQGRAGLLPTVGVGGSYSRVGADSTLLSGDRNSTTNGYTVSLSQPLFRWANWEQYQQGKLQTSASEALFAQAGQDLIVRVSQAYFDVLTAQDALASIQAQKAAITEQLASAKRNFEVGTATITDTHEAQARFDLAAAQELSAESDLDIKRAALQQIIGKPAGELAALRPGLQLSAPQPAQIDKWVETAEAQNYGVIGQQLGLEIAQREIKRNRAGHSPTVDLVASRNHNNQMGSTLTLPANVSNSNTVGVQWNIPLFAGFAVTSKVREAIALEDKARADLENARRTAALGARQSFLGVNSGLAQVKALEAAEVSSQSALESNQLGYQVGVRINIDVLNAQQQLFATRRDLAKARYDTLVNGLKLKSAAGTLQEDDLTAVNQLLAQGPAGARPEPVKPIAAHSGGATAKPMAAAESSSAAEAVLNTVTDWAKAWSSRDTKAYLGFYSAHFKAPHGHSRKAWESQRIARIEGKKNIDVKIDAPKVTVDGDTATVKFRQIYAADNVSATDNKVLILVKQNGAWHIRRETSAG